MADNTLIWIVDDDAAIRELLSFIVNEAGYEVDAFSSGAEVLAHSSRQPGAVLLDLMMPGVDGVAVLKEISRRFPKLPVIMITADNDIRRAVEVTKLGAYDYLVKPVDKERLLTTLDRALSHGTLEKEVVRLKGELSDRFHLRNIVGSSDAMRKVYDQVEKVLESEITVFIAGESGTGKELVAKAIHYASLRSDGPFIDVNCAAIPEGLQESELFGHEKGAFTGALATHPGKFEQAAAGTIFLDEIGEMSQSAQARLLRVLQERVLQRVGGTESIALDVRVISASNRDLAQMVEEGSFRQDLFYRLVVFPITLPPLRDRRDDIPLLVEQVLEKHARDAGKKVTRVEPKAMEALASHGWPGNVRELENVVHRTLLVVAGLELKLDDLPPNIIASESGVSSPVNAVEARSSSGPKSLEDLEREAIVAAMESNRGNLSDVARQLGIGRSTLYRKLEQYGLREKK
ncbi:MAG: sigma-54 dependent transcriptional regulator [Acidobacteriota bacterium]|nr:sigma-54 dependent transcriptional regulator [Acidobacteriota bacterium]